MWRLLQYYGNHYPVMLTITRFSVIVFVSKICLHHFYVTLFFNDFLNKYILID